MAPDRLPARDDDTLLMGGPASGDTQSIPAINTPVAEDDGIGGLLPMLDDPRRRFDTVMRGYDRHQVDQYVGKLEDDNRLLATGRSENSTRVSDLAAQLASAQAEIESLRRRVAAAVETIDPDNVDARVQEVVALAQQVARQTRTDAETEALRIRESAVAAADTMKAESKADADQIVAAATQRLSDADQSYTQKVGEADAHAAEVSARAEEELGLAREEVATLRAVATREVTELRATATQEVGTLRATAAEEIAEAATTSSAARTEADRVSREAREKADAEAAAKRAQAEEDFEITLRLRRKREEDEDRERRSQALREATAIVTDANNTADRIVREARSEVERLDHERHRVHPRLPRPAGGATCGG